MTKAVIYARYSCENQREESIEGQIRECLAFAKHKGFEVVDKYIDRAISAKTDDRPSFQQMIHDGTDHKFDVVIVWKMDRFSRNRLNALQYKSILKKAHVKLISATEAISDGPEGILLESVLDGMAEYYSADLAQKVKRGMTENILEGKSIGGVIPFGYKVEDKRYVINDEEAVILREIFRLYSETAITCKALARSLNEKGLLNKGKPFNSGSIHGMLKNKKYVGIYGFGDHFNNTCIPPIVDKETFDNVQLKMANRKIHSSCFRAKSNYLLSGKVYCGLCGSLWVGVSSRKKELTYNWYRCKEYLDKRKCVQPGIRASLLEDIVLKESCDFLRDKFNREKMAKAIYESQNIKSPVVLSLETQLKDTKDKMANIISAIEKGADFSILQERYKSLEETRKILEDNLEIENSKSRKYSLETIQSRVNSFSSLELKDSTSKRNFIENFINSVFVFPDGRITIVYTNNPNLPPLKLESLSFKENSKTDRPSLEKGLFVNEFTTKSIRFATNQKKQKRSIYMNATSSYFMNLDRLFKVLKGIRPYDKENELKISKVTLAKQIKMISKAL